MRLASCLVPFIAWSGLLAAARTVDSAENKKCIVCAFSRKVLEDIPVSQLAADVAFRHRQILNSVDTGTVPFQCALGFTGSACSLLLVLPVKLCSVCLLLALHPHMRSIIVLEYTDFIIN